MDGTCDHGFCDFCNKPVINIYRHTVQGQVVDCVLRGGDFDYLTIAHSADWCACGICFDLISRGYWDILINRVMRSLGCLGDKPLELLLRVTYSKAFNTPEILTAMVSSLRSSPARISSTL
jgi:hypothetical protein